MESRRAGAGTRRSVRRLVLLAMLVLATSLAGIAQSATPAEALCVSPQITGRWQNVQATRSIVKAENSFVCNDVVRCPIDGGPCTGGQSWLNVRLWGQCTPLCDWGTRQATYQSDGWWMATWNHGYAVRYGWVRPEQHYGLTYMRVDVYTDFTAADGRQDYWSTDWMLPG